MSEPNAFVSPEYPVLFSVRESGPEEGTPDGYASLSLALLVDGIPSFLATVPVDRDHVGDVEGSLGSGDVRVAVVGISVEGTELPAEAAPPVEPWEVAPESGDPDPRTLPAAFLSLICRDGRRIGVARIVAREDSATPEAVARYVLKQITKGVQVPDLASTG